MQVYRHATCVGDNQPPFWKDLKQVLAPLLWGGGVVLCGGTWCGVMWCGGMGCGVMGCGVVCCGVVGWEGCGVV